MVETRFDKIVVRSKLPTPFASAEAFGAGAGRALQRTGAVMANVADKALAEIDRQKQKDAVNKGMQFENSFDKLRREKVNSDYLTRKGQAALGTTAAWEKDAEEWYINYSKSGSKTEIEMFENGGNLGGGSVAESS